MAELGCESIFPDSSVSHLRPATSLPQWLWKNNVNGTHTVLIKKVSSRLIYTGKLKSMDFIPEDEGVGKT